jgi:hypothetical protein
MSNEPERLKPVCLKCKRLNKQAWQQYECHTEPDCPAMIWTVEIKIKVMKRIEKI